VPEVSVTLRKLLAFRDSDFNAGFKATKIHHRPITRVKPMHRTERNTINFMVPDDTFEKHYRIGDLAEMWSLGRETIRKMLVDEPGVIKVRMGRRKTHTTYSVPASVAERIHKRLSDG
jgi:hypothetical protein